MNQHPDRETSRPHSADRKSARTKIRALVATPKWSIRRFIVLWASAILLAFGLLCGGLLYAAARQHDKTSRIFSSSLSLQINRAFEATILSQGRADLLHSSDSARSAQKARLREADDLLAQLQAETDSPRETELAQTIAREYRTFRRAETTSSVQKTALQNAAVQKILDRILQPLREHRQINEQQMDATMKAANRLDAVMGRLAILLILVAGAIVVAGSIELWARIFKPTMQLAHAAQSFGSDLKTRAPVLRDDEMGQLARIFNAMAESIADRERERLRFVATVAHDLRNPLVVIGGAASLLRYKEEKFTAEERAEWLGNIIKNSRRLETMIADLTDGVQAETGQLAFDMEVFDFSEMMRETTREHAAATATHLIRLEENAPPCLILGDRNRLERVLMNLLSNAVKYSPRGCEVAVLLRHGTARYGSATDKAGGATHAILEVRDEGAGIAPDDLPKLFLPFTRLDRTRKMASGTGLGLSSVKKIVEAHGGTIEVQSAPDVGTTVIVRVPLSDKSTVDFDGTAIL